MQGSDDQGQGSDSGTGVGQGSIPSAPRTNIYIADPFCDEPMSLLPINLFIMADTSPFPVLPLPTPVAV